MDLQRRRVQIIVCIVGIVGLSLIAEECREMVGEEAASKSGKFTIFNCFDMGTGTVACGVKEGIRLYFYNLRAAHVERTRLHAMEAALTEALTGGLDAKAAAKQTQTEGTKAAKLAKKQAKRILGPIVASGWDFFEAIYYGGTLTEGFLRGTGTLFGTYAGGFLGDEKLGRFGYLIGSHLGSWVGGRIGLMVYDVVNGVHYLFYSLQNVESTSAAAFEETYEETPDQDKNNGNVYESIGDSDSAATSEETPFHDTVDSTVYQSLEESTETSYESPESSENSYESTESSEEFL
ncbi:hypothetical protein H6P81_002387 [Aristolochia fimbriata]|uniref:Uncharacterized protein n=1 Tax=Aristolochia fimbriata TaxID=158543 RepID=A0AAV7FBA5_ARIFI|nr:hypothetical protein H6P81_002387 [Aristolochia fimbriata]